MEPQALPCCILIAEWDSYQAAAQRQIGRSRLFIRVGRDGLMRLITGQAVARCRPYPTPPDAVGRSFNIDAPPTDFRRVVSRLETQAERVGMDRHTRPQKLQRGILSMVDIIRCNTVAVKSFEPVARDIHYAIVRHRERHGRALGQQTVGSELCREVIVETRRGGGQAVKG